MRVTKVSAHRVCAVCERYGMPLMIEPLVLKANEEKGGYQVDGNVKLIVPLVRQARELISDSDFWGFNFVQEIENCWRALSGLGQFISDPNQPQAAKEAARLDAQSAADWIRSLDVHPLAKKHFIAHIRSEYTTEPERFSLLDLARKAKMYYTELDRPPSLRVMGGNDQIPHALSDALPDVRLSAPVTSIRLKLDGVTVTFKQADSHLTLDSDFAVLAIPLTTARLIDLNGSLPTVYQTMVDDVSYGAVTKVMIEYRKRLG